MNSDRDPEADDLFVDHGLQQELGGQRPPDLAQRIVAAGPERWAAAAGRVDAAAAEVAVSRGTWWRLRIAVAVLFGLAAIGYCLRDSLVRSPSLTETAQSLIDDFHRVMPGQLVRMREEVQRQAVAPQAIPAIRAILAFHAEHPTETTFGARIFEFEVYALELGDGELERALQQRAVAGDLAAAAALSAARLATSAGAERAAALTELGAHLRQRPDLASSILMVLGTADLSLAEADQIADAFVDPGLRRNLRRDVELASTGPQRLVGQPLELFGRLVDDRVFSTASLRGKVVLVCCWASWCRPCIDVLARVRRLQAQYPELVVVGVSCDHDVAALKACLDSHHDPRWLQFFDRRRPGWHEFALVHGIGVVPFLLLLDREGTVTDVDPRASLELAVQRQFAR